MLGDELFVDLPCSKPECQHVFQVSISELRENPHLVCPLCGSRTTFEPPPAKAR